ncbi:MAG: peptidoglycan binding protein CsiV [Gammaproteobacteria bacterium]|nr:peptidoglycan binding protein CsiV [Gammaproteobacteria bacterium]
MRTFFKTCFYFFLLLTASITLHAEEEATSEQANTEQSSKPVKKQYYIVEVILFKHLNEQGKLDEFWTKPDVFNHSLSQGVDFNSNTTTEPVLTDDSPALAEYDLQNKRFLPLRNGVAATSTANYKLSDSAAHLRYSPNYKLLAHFGWTQRSLSKNRALPIRINSNQFSDSLIPSGEIKLYVSRYLHMLVDLQASKCDYTNTEKISDEALDKQLESGQSKLEIEAGLQNTGTDTTECVNNVYKFKQNRKMRSRELHYIDNPVFGMLVYVTPFTIDNTNTAKTE